MLLIYLTYLAAYSGSRVGDPTWVDLSLEDDEKKEQNELGN